MAINIQVDLTFLKEIYFVFITDVFVNSMYKIKDNIIILITFYSLAYRKYVH